MEEHGNNINGKIDGENNLNKFIIKNKKLRKKKNPPPLWEESGERKKGREVWGYRIQGIKTQKWKPLTNSNIIMS